MRVIVAVLGVVATVGCQGRPARTRNDTPVVAPRDADAGRAATAVREVTKTAAADVTKAGVTSAGGSVWRIGEPRMRVTRHANGGLVVSLAAKRAVATDGGVVKIWELEHGTLVARISPAGPAPAAPAGDALSFLVMSPQATRLAVYRESGLASVRGTIQDAAPHTHAGVAARLRGSWAMTTATSKFARPPPVRCSGSSSSTRRP